MAAWANRDKSGAPIQKRDKWASWENCDLFPGHVVKNRDCPGKSGRMVTLPNPADLKDTLHNDTGRRADSLQATVLLAAEVSDAEADMWSGPVELKRRTGQRRTKSRSRQATNAMCWCYFSLAPTVCNYRRPLHSSCENVTQTLH